jgi:hypothetical protein
MLVILESAGQFIDTSALDELLRECVLQHAPSTLSLDLSSGPHSDL